MADLVSCATFHADSSNTHYSKNVIRSDSVAMTVYSGREWYGQWPAIRSHGRSFFVTDALLHLLLQAREAGGDVEKEKRELPNCDPEVRERGWASQSEKGEP